MSELHPTPTRLALLRDVAHWHVYRRRGVDYDSATDRTVTARMAELERAGWVELGGERELDRLLWRLTPAGRAVLDTHGGAR